MRKKKDEAQYSHTLTHTVKETKKFCARMGAYVFARVCVHGYVSLWVGGCMYVGVYVCVLVCGSVTVTTHVNIY